MTAHLWSTKDILYAVSFVVVTSQCFTSQCFVLGTSLFPDEYQDSSPLSDDLGNEQLLAAIADSPALPTNKRYASMTYSYGGSRGGYGRRGWRNSYRPYGYSSSRQNYRNQQTWRPWERLPDTMCYRQRCSSSDDCCMRYNKCDRYARVCHDCWYGYPCQTSDDCCQKYPYCNRRKQCSN